MQHGCLIDINNDFIEIWGCHWKYNFVTVAEFAEKYEFSRLALRTNCAAVGNVVAASTGKIHYFSLQ